MGEAKRRRLAAVMLSQLPPIPDEIKTDIAKVRSIEWTHPRLVAGASGAL
jgi:hypothetical protein